MEQCGLTVIAVEGNTVRDVNVFNSSSIKSANTTDDPDLGSPNQFCPGGGPGVGNGGKPEAPFSNCEPQGNLLIIQNPANAENDPNDNGSGGCLFFKFERLVEVVNMGLLDMDEIATVTVIDDTNNVITSFQSPPNVGNNGFWPVNKTAPAAFLGADDVKLIQVCMKNSGAVSSIEYYDCGGPSPTFTDIPTPSPSFPPTNKPTKSPTPLPTTSLPTSSPTPVSCPYVKCDFASLIPNVFLSQQGAELLAKCGVKVSAKEGNIVRNVNVFNSSNIKSKKATDDPDLGSPNEKCPGGGPGRGVGGEPTSPFPNCVPQGNLLVIQDNRTSPNVANDSPFGGCFLFEFTSPIEMVNTGILDVEEPGVSVTVSSRNHIGCLL
jgi:hypothetical protein